MQGPGQSLRQAREAHGRTIEEMSEATGIRLPFLTALEQDAFDSLPGRAFGKLYIRAYAEVLGFDPRPMIEAYDHVVLTTDRTTDAAAPDSGPAPAPRPINAVLARWRNELIARRAEAAASGNPEESDFDPPEAAEDETGAEFIEDAARTAPPFTDLAVESIEEVPAPALSGETVTPAPPSSVDTVTPSPPVPSRRWPVASLFLLLLLPPLAYFVVSRSAPDPPTVAVQSEPAPGKASVAPPALPRSPQAAEVPRTPPPAPSPVREPAASPIEVAESGVGLRLVGTRLEGEADRFRTGQRVTFATRVVGGGAGDSIRHVWLRDGKVEQSIRLRLGGASWRTWSTKTLGRPGAWAVEARDEQGRVLARADLTVAP